MSKETTEARLLECILTPSILSERAKELAYQNEEKLRFKDTVADINAKAKEAEKNVNRLSKIVDEGKEFRDIECKWEFNYDESTKELVRQDTFETIETQPLAAHERQQEMFPRVA